jgi:hypothetical protein
VEVSVQTGITDGLNTEITGGDLALDAPVILRIQASLTQ